MSSCSAPSDTKPAAGCGCADTVAAAPISVRRASPAHGMRCITVMRFPFVDFLESASCWRSATVLLRLQESQRGNAGFVGKVGSQCVQRGAPEAQAGVQRAFHLDVKPTFNGPRHELVRHHVDQHARRKADEGKDRGKLDQQAAAKLAAPQPRHQPHGNPSDHQQQQPCHAHVDDEQAGVVLLIQCAVIGRLRQQEQQHQANRDHRSHSHTHRPAQRTGIGLRRGHRRVRVRVVHLTGSIWSRTLRLTDTFQSDCPTAVTVATR